MPPSVPQHKDAPNRPGRDRGDTHRLGALGGVAADEAADGEGHGDGYAAEGQLAEA
jgi:hypothetical protein